MQLELELEAAAKAAAETEKGILEYMRWEIAALEEREPPQWVRDYLDDRLAALMSAWRIKDDCTMILEAMKNQEIQYLQQNKRKSSKPKDRGKPDW